ncbi:hypothetical protein ASF44_23770 [Pseudorhodoferax sp. Leaf274]|nr:hypothetical protein ASF44_23770 [Pseudorhodoferax sp. Leaf274]
MPCDVIVITTPLAVPVPPGVDALVATDATYFVPEPVLTSQPQPLALIVVPEAADWIVSVMLVLHDEPAKIASDTFARAV